MTVGYPPGNGALTSTPAPAPPGGGPTGGHWELPPPSIGASGQAVLGPPRWIPDRGTGPQPGAAEAQAARDKALADHYASSVEGVDAALRVGLNVYRVKPK